MNKQTNTCRARDKAYPALSGLDFWHYLGSLAASVYFNRPEADQRGSAFGLCSQFHRGLRTDLGNFYQPQNFSS